MPESGWWQATVLSRDTGQEVVSISRQDPERAMRQALLLAYYDRLDGIDPFLDFTYAHPMGLDAQRGTLLDRNE